ncbi:MAG: PepSY-like domain-containing protein [Gelidibacter sp.]
MKNLKVAALLFFATATISAQDLKNSEVPSNLQSVFSKAYSNAKDIEWEKKGDHFKVEFEINRMDHDVWYDAQGKVLKSKIKISKKELPSVVASAIKTKYPDYKIDSVEVQEQNDIKSYEIEIEKGWNEERKLVIDSSGKILRDIED